MKKMWNDEGKKVLYIKSMKFSKDGALVPNSLKERYEEFQKQFPEICKKVNLKYIASYLGITLSTLSRLRSKKP